MHEESANYEEVIREEELEADHIAEHPIGTDEDQEEEDLEEEDEE